MYDIEIRINKEINIDLIIDLIIGLSFFVNIDNNLSIKFVTRGIENNKEIENMIENKIIYGKIWFISNLFFFSCKGNNKFIYSISSSDKGILFEGRESIFLSNI